MAVISTGRLKLARALVEQQRRFGLNGGDLDWEIETSKKSTDYTGVPSLNGGDLDWEIETIINHLPTQTLPMPEWR